MRIMKFLPTLILSGYLWWSMESERCYKDRVGTIVLLLP
jgi:hypothetical protein